jgi:peptidyl-prolyl cis-trans isomerase B (cyclophilin B)
VGFFDNTHCHRLTTAAAGIYVLQCGDPTGTGMGGPGYTIPDENLTGATYPTGTVAMANTGAPHSGGSQFFIVYKNSPLPPSYTPFGTVTSGLSVIQRVAAAGSTQSNGPGDGAPKIPVDIKTVKMS